MIKKYLPQTCVWEVTMGCNMRCKHCGSSCENALKEELSTEEAFNFIDMCRDIGLVWITLSGGEPLIRKDLPLLIKKLNDNKILVNMITNGWLMDEEIAKILKENGINTVAISIDGNQEIHDKIRRPNSFVKCKKAFEILKKYKINTTCVTTVSKLNIDILNELKDTLVSIGVNSWQIQIGLPMGNFSVDWLLDPKDINKIIDFIFKTKIENKISIYSADCIGYYDQKNMIDDSIWKGCNAGIRSFGILHNGDILGCTSIRNNSFIEGNIKNKTLREIWENPKSFLWRRNQNKECLKGDCKICKYGSYCLGGCANLRFSINKNLDSENLYCSYNLRMKNLRKKLLNINNFELLLNLAQNNINDKRYQEAMFLLNRIIEIDPKNNLAIDLLKNVNEKCDSFKF